MAIRVNTDLQALYIFEPEGHTVPAMNVAQTFAGLYRLEADVNLDTLVAARYGETAGTTYWGAFLDSDGVNIRIRGDNGGGLVQSGTYTLVVGREYRLALVYNGSGTITLYDDHTVLLTLSFTPNAGTSGQRALQWGGYGEISGYTSSTYARWRFWSSALTPTQLRAEHRSTAPVITSGLLGDWPMNAGSGRLNNTVSGEPDLSENAFIPVGDGTAFVYRPSIIGTPFMIKPGASATPGAQSFTVPDFAEGVAVFCHGAGTGASANGMTSLSSNFAETLTLTEANSIIGASMWGACAFAKVTSTGASKTLTPVYDEAQSLVQTGLMVAFVQDFDPTTPLADIECGNSTNGSAARTLTATSSALGLAICSDARIDTGAGGSYPANEGGWTSLLTDQSQGTYYMPTRLRSILPSGTSQTATTQNTLASSIGLISLAPKALAGDTTDPVLSSPSATTIDHESAAGEVTTDEANGTLYFYASTNSTESSSTIIASGQSQAVNATGVQEVTFTGLPADTTLYPHYVQVDEAANVSNVVSGSSFTTDEAPPITTAVITGVVNVAMPNTADSGNVNITIPAGSNACYFGGTYYVGTTSVVSSFTGSALTSVNLQTMDGSAIGMTAYAGHAKVTATGAQTVRMQKTGNYTEGPTCQIVFMTVADPDDFVEELEIAAAAIFATQSVTLASTADHLVIGMRGKDVSNTLTAPSGTTQQGTTQTNNSDSSMVFTVDSPGDPSTTMTTSSINYPTFHGISIKPGVGGGGTDDTADGVTLTAAASIIDGDATGVRSPTATGQTLPAAASLIPGNASGVRSPTANGQTLTAAASFIDGDATGITNVTANGQTLTAAASIIDGDAVGVQSPTANGQTLTAAASIIDGDATGETNGTADGETLTAAASLIPGTATAAVNDTADGQTLPAAASLVPGTATAEVNGTAAGATFTVAASLIEGDADGVQSPTADGQTLTAAASLVPGNASAGVSPTVDGVTFTVAASIIDGDATGVQNPTADGQTLVAAASLIAGNASGVQSPTADGQTLTAAASFIAGNASAGVSPTADGVVLTAAASLIDGDASGQVDGTADGQTMTAAASLIDGDAIGEVNGTADGVTMIAAASLIAGDAFAGVGGDAAGTTFTVASSIIDGDATSTRAPTVDGATMVAAASMVGGDASAVRSPTADGVTVSAAASLVAGNAGGGADSTANGVTLTAAASLIEGAADGEVVAVADGVLLTAAGALVAGAADGVRNVTAEAAFFEAIATFIEGAAGAYSNEPSPLVAEVPAGDYRAALPAQNYGVDVPGTDNDYTAYV